MANFAAHLYGSAVVSSAGALGVYSLGWVGQEQAQALFLVGVVGGLLPDIDSDNSAPIRAFFSLIGVSAAFAAAFALVGRYPVPELALIWGGTFLVARYGILEIFTRFTVHRGVWHSWLAMLFSALAIANAGFHLLGLSARNAWLAGFFVALGYLTHLCLDELVSLDLLGNRGKRSFGTALKPFSFASPRASLAMLCAVLLLAYLAPTLGPVLEAGKTRGLSVDALQSRILEHTHWLAGLLGVGR